MLLEKNRKGSTALNHSSKQQGSYTVPTLKTTSFYFNQDCSRKGKTVPINTTTAVLYKRLCLNFYSGLHYYPTKSKCFAKVSEPAIFGCSRLYGEFDALKA